MIPAECAARLSDGANDSANYGINNLPEMLRVSNGRADLRVVECDERDSVRCDVNGPI